jgi:hypothetical protein
VARGAGSGSDKAGREGCPERVGACPGEPAREALAALVPARSAACRHRRRMLHAV